MFSRNPSIHQECVINKNKISSIDIRSWCASRLITCDYAAVDIVFDMVGEYREVVDMKILILLSDIRKFRCCSDWLKR